MDFTSSIAPESPIKFAVLPKNLNNIESSVSLNLAGNLGQSTKKKG